MYWMDAFKLAEIHREVYAAILKSWVPHGQREDFARACGIAKEYLSCLCALDNPLDGTVPIHKRYPSPRLAIRMAKILPAPKEIRRSLLENMELVHVAAVESYYQTSVSWPHSLLIQRLKDIDEQHLLATYGQDRPEVKRAYRIVRDASRSLLGQIDPENSPDSYVQACLYYHNAQCILNRADEALRYSKIAQAVFESAEMIEPGYSREQRYNLEMNAVRGEAVAYHNLQIDRKALSILRERVNRLPAYRQARDFWEPIVIRDVINSMVRIPRFSIREVGLAVHKGELGCEKSQDRLTLFLLHEGWLRSLVVFKKWKEAQKIFDKEITDMPHIPSLGPLHKVLLLKMGAKLAWGTGDLVSWKTRVQDCWTLARRAGLSHQMQDMLQCFGNKLDPVLGEINLKVDG
jgi:hypothetical protein